jgi:GDP-L-fucose synthase
MLKKKIYIAGHNGMVGSALVRELLRRGYSNLLTKSRQELDLLEKKEVADFFKKNKPDYVFLCAAKVGGILANSISPYDFLAENIQIQTNVITGALGANVRNLCFMGSSCVYPKMSPQPISENELLTSPLEATNEAYAIAKIAGIKMCDYIKTQFGLPYFSVMPTNLYGKNDNYDLQNSHVLPALIRKVHKAKVDGADRVTVWGSGTPKREFLYVDDLADACAFLLEKGENTGAYNVGVGLDITISDLAKKITNIIGFTGEIIFDTKKPDGTPRKLLDVSKLGKLGWTAKTSLDEGIKKTYKEYINSLESRFD